MKSRRFGEAEQKAASLRKTYEATFNPKLRQYAFQSKVEFQEFSQTTTTPFEQIDWGYKECLQAQAFLATEKRDFPAALAALKLVEALAPVSASTAIETGFVLNQLGRNEAALSAYHRAQVLSTQYASQRPYRAVALRGLGFTMIEMKQWDNAEKLFRQSLEFEPDSAVALNELGYIRDQRSAR